MPLVFVMQLTKNNLSSCILQHPFSAGLTLSQLSAVSTDGEWVPTFIHDEANTIHKV